MNSVASTSSSSVQKSFKYDVFLSFRGEDTRKTFIDHLYLALANKGIITYKDDETIEKGERISDQLIRSIEESRFYIIVFSKNYANSSWCLNELAKIMECQRSMQQTAYPLFYDVEPTEVRNQTGAVGKAFAKHVEKEAAGRWKDALKEAADLAGWELKATFDGHEAKFVQKIVQDISLEPHFINSSIDGKLVGMDFRVKEVVLSLETGSDDVRMIGIRGMGGAGKTTLARAVYDHISIWFKAKCFVENVRERSKGSGLKELQKHVLSTVTNDQSIVVNGIFDGINMMKRMMVCRKVLLVLDDVDHTEQLEALAGELTWFNPGSRIIITTRDEQILKAHGVHSNNIHDASLLTREEALCLFSRFAFKSEIPILGYEELSEKVVHYAAGLPLTIKVLGSFLFGRVESEWKDAIERLKTIPLKETLEKLELSYNGLENDQKEIFLDVACILKGERKDVVIRILESCGFHGEIGLRVLEQKSLINISDYGYLDMHDHIEEMGVNIVRRSHPEEPNRHSRLWINEEIEHVLANDLGTKVTRSLKLKYLNLDLSIRKGFRKMKGLRFLCINSYGTTFDEANLYLPNTLRSLHLSNNHFHCLPNTFQANNLVDLDIHLSSISQLWEGGERKVLNKLKFLNLSYSKLRTFDLGLTPNLETLNLGGCNELVEFHMPSECPCLKLLYLSGSKLTNLKLGLIPNLKSLDLVECNELVELHMPSECPRLESLNLSGSKLTNLKLGLIPNLKSLDLVECNELVELHMPSECPFLEVLNLSGCKLTNLKLGLIPILERLDLGECNELVELHMPSECPRLKFLDLSGSKVSNLNLGSTPHLERLYLKECYYLQEIHAPIGWLKEVVQLEFSGCSKCIMASKQYGFPEHDRLATLKLFAESRYICPLHPNTSFPKFQLKCVYEEPLPFLSGNVERLISFGLCACTNLERFSATICGWQHLGRLKLEGSIPEVPKDLNKLESLKELSLSMKEIKHLPDNICMLKHLKYLKLRYCQLLEQLPKNIGRLECLEELHLTNCISLREIPNSVCQLKSLKYLDLHYCILVENLPEEFGRLASLKQIDLEGVGIRDLPQSIFQLIGLCIVGSTWQLESYGFTSLENFISDTAFCYIKDSQHESQGAALQTNIATGNHVDAQV